MQDSIKSSLDNPSVLEKLYRKNKAAFKENFNKIYTEYQDKPLVQFWNERLNYDFKNISWGSIKELRFV